MQKFSRVAIIDRSFLANNIYDTILKPHGFSLFFFKTIKELMEQERLGFQLILINANIGNGLQDSLSDLCIRPHFFSLGKILFCGEKEFSHRSWFEKNPNHLCLEKPFHPEELLRMMNQLLEKTNDNTSRPAKGKKAATTQDLPH